MDSRKSVLQETGKILAGEVICVGIMLAVFALAGALDRSVVLGGLLGMVLAVGNFFLLAVNATVASDRAVRQDVKSGVMMMRMSYLLRLIVMFVILLVCVRSGYCNAIASVIPLAMFRPILTLGEFFRKKEDA